MLFPGNKTYSFHTTKNINTRNQLSRSKQEEVFLEMPVSCRSSKWKEDKYLTRRRHNEAGKYTEMCRRLTVDTSTLLGPRHAHNQV